MPHLIFFKDIDYNYCFICGNKCFTGSPSSDLKIYLSGVGFRFRVGPAFINWKENAGIQKVIMILCTTSDKQANDSEIYDGFTAVLLEIVLEMER